MALNDFFVPVCMVDKRTVPDGLGGVDVTYIDGAHFMAGIVAKQNTQAQIAYQQGLKTIYTVVFKPTAGLSFGDRIKRLSDGLMLKITSNARDMTTPERADIQLSQVSAEVIEP